MSESHISRSRLFASITIYPLALTMLLGLGIAWPAESQIGDLSSMSIEQLMDVPVTTASKKAEPMSRTPAAVFVITHEDIERFGYRTLAEALGQVIGIYSGTDRNYDYASVRGLAHSQDNYNQRVLVLIDGHRINELIYDYGPIGADFPLDMRSVERIEVVKGPGSALWGTDAMLAVVNVVSKTAADIDKPRFAAIYGSNSTQEAFAEYATPAAGPLKIAASASSMRSNGESSIYFPEFDDPSTNNGVAHNMDDEEAQKGYLHAQYGSFEFMFNQGRRFKSFPTASYGILFDSKPAFTDDRTSYAELRFARTTSPKHNGSFYARVYQDRYDYHCDVLYPDPTILNRDYASGRWWGAEARYCLDPSPRVSSVIGLEYMGSGRAKRGNYDVEPYTLYYESDTRPSVYSGYMQLDYDIRDTLKVVTGVRMDRYPTFGRHWSPRVGLVYVPDRSQSFKLLRGTAFRAPTDSEIWGVYSTNFDLKPEEMTTTELVWEREIGHATRVVTSLYSLNLNGAICEVAEDEESSQYQNVGSFDSKGLEMQFESRLPGDIRSHLGFSLLKTSDTGNASISAPRALFLGGISLPVLSGRFYLSPDLIFIGNRKTLSGGDTGPIRQVDLTLKSIKPLGGLDVSLRARNLFNSNNYVPATVSYTQDRLPMPGRTIELEISRPL